jgi:hypothetical protein
MATKGGPLPGRASAFVTRYGGGLIGCAAGLEGASEVQLAEGREEHGGPWWVSALDASAVEAQGLGEGGVAGEEGDDGPARLDRGGVATGRDDAKGGLGGPEDLDGVGIFGEVAAVDEIGRNLEKATKGGEVGSRKRGGDAGSEVRAEDAQSQGVGEAAPLVFGIESGAVVSGLVEEVCEGASEVTERLDGAVARRVEGRGQA